jgi:hypothetical protein
MNRLRHLRIWAVARHQWMAGTLLALFLSVFALTLSEALCPACQNQPTSVKSAKLQVLACKHGAHKSHPPKPR